MYIFDISVDLLERRKVVGSALLKFGTDIMAWYPAFRKAGFEDIGRLEVDVDDCADGVKRVKNGKEEDWVTWTFSIGHNAGKEPMYSRAAPPRAHQKKAVKNILNLLQKFWFSYRMYHIWMQRRSLCDRMSEHICDMAKKTEGKCYYYQLKAEVVRAICND
ncbi:hypothetical protein B0H13DRAFT_1898381 [Mycena leptocephala]|nr:hypothetical protein B0H13DRAFT_1898381 [Mycena leptocephala]